MNEGRKFDSGKPRPELLPPVALEEISKVLAHGAAKYGEWNWAKGMRWSRLIGAALRHIFAWMRGEDNDPEWGLSHLAHAACCLLFLLHYERTAAGGDDRWHKLLAENVKPELGVAVRRSEVFCADCAAGVPHTHD